MTTDNGMMPGEQVFNFCFETRATLARVDLRYPGIARRVFPYLEKALAEQIGGRDWELSDIIEQASASRVAIWALVAQEPSDEFGEGEVFGACATCETQYPQRKVLEILLLGAEPHTENLWLQAFEELKNTARAYGCDAVVGTGRLGWARKLHGIEKRIFEVPLATQGQ